MSQEYVSVLEAAGLTEAARIIAAMNEGNPEPETPAPTEPVTPAPQTQAETDGAALLEGIRASGVGEGWTTAGSLMSGGNDR